MAFDVLDLEVTQLFKNDDTYYVPRYQRNYVWREQNWNQLLNDIRYCAEVTPNWSHFIGSMVFERKQKNGGKVYIIDGQQRIITLQIAVFAVIYCFYQHKVAAKKNKEINECDRNIQYFQDLIINKSLGKETSIKVESGYHDFTVLNQVFLDLDADEINRIHNDISSGKKSKSIIYKAFYYFVDDFQRLSLSTLSKFSQQFVKTRVVTISSSQEEEVYNIFEILNARGVKLQQVELLKNYLFKYLKPKKLLDSYKDKWSELEECLDGIDLDDYYLHTFKVYHYKPKLSKDQLFETTKDYLQRVEPDKLANFFDYFISCGKLYKNIVEAIGDGEESDVYQYFSIKKNKQARTILLSLKLKCEDGTLNKEQYCELLKLIRNFYVSFNLCNGISNKLDTDVYMMSNGIYKSEDAIEIENAICNFLIKYSTYFKNEKVFQDGLHRLVYSNKTIRQNVSSKMMAYFFRPLFLSKEINEYAEYDFSKFNIEHILNDSSDDEHTYSIGNLLLVPSTLNSKMKDHDFLEKKKILLNSNIPYLVDFVKEYPSFSHEEIDKREVDIILELKQLFLLSFDDLSERAQQCTKYLNMKQNLISVFGDNCSYLEVLRNRGFDKFVTYINNNDQLPEEDKTKILNLIDN